VRQVFEAEGQMSVGSRRRNADELWHEIEALCGRAKGPSLRMTAGLAPVSAVRVCRARASQGGQPCKSRLGTHPQCPTPGCCPTSSAAT
jgi:hypothetical protein